MPAKRDVKKSKIQDIQWAENDNHLIWLLLGELEKDANCKVLFGKKDKNEVKCPFISFSRRAELSCHRTPVVRDGGLI